MRLLRLRPPTGIALAFLFPLAAVSFAQTTATTTKTAKADDEVFVLNTYEVKDMRDFADQAILAKTPVAFTEFSKDQIIESLGSRDIPMVLNTSPSVFATTDGGGAGDSRINVRGFDQRNVSIMINGVPTNDMENGWLYWSNWDGLGDVTAAIQMQRGLSNVTLPTPSIGGTMNIITDPATQKRGGSIKFETGYDSFMKTTAVYSSGLLNNKFAITVGAVAKKGDEAGSVRGTWTEGYGYYLGTIYKINAKNRLEFFAIGAPQRHGQRTFASNIAAYDASYARKLGYTDADIAKAGLVGAVDSGRDFNPNVNAVSSSYAGLQYWNGGTHSRKESGVLNERENYFHKPQMNLNWYSTLTDDLKLGTVFYFSGGVGGGSGTLTNGSNALAYDGSGAINWDKSIAANAGSFRVNGTTAKTAGQSVGILRNSVNVQRQVGIVSKLSYELSPAIKLTAGVDWRTYHADHYQEVRDLLGGSYYLASSTQASQFWADGTNTKLVLGDKVGYYYRSDVDWLGGFIQGQYDEGSWHGYATYGRSMTDYGYTNYFFKNSSGSAVSLSPGTYTGQQIKGGLRYTINSQWSVFGNAGWVTKAPAFTTAISTYSVKLPSDVGNEKFTSLEGGARWESKDKKLNVTGSYYYTVWTNRSNNTSSSSAYTYRRGIDGKYTGVELESAYDINQWVRLDAAATIARWVYTSNGTYETYSESTGALTGSGKLYISGLKIGDAPQRQLAAGVTVYPLTGLSVKLQGYWYDRYWADFEPQSRTSATDVGESWRIPSYSTFELHVNYKLPLKSNIVEVNTFLHVFNIFDKVYVSDATDNSSYEGVAGAASHSAQRAEVFMGAPFAINAGVKFTF